MKQGSSRVVPICICCTSMLPPFSRGGIVRRQVSLALPSGPQIEIGNAAIGCGGSAMPPAAPSAVSRANQASTSGRPGNTPTEPMKAS